MYYGPSPFYWLWNNKFDTTPTAGDYFYDNSFGKYFICCYTLDNLENHGDEVFIMYYNNIKFIFIPLKYLNNYFKRGKLLPVLGKQIACSVALKPLLKNFISSLKIVVVIPKFTRDNHVLSQNRNILKLWLNDNIDEQKQKINLLCLFHDDHNPSAIYNFATGFFRCYACKKICKNLYLHLKRINHPILNQL
jgi:hypothetical protein